ncbi:MAG: amino acid ABC transporter ATPase [Rothia sp. (in: high G+C Gram-positive bacteria)]|uniref:amino acid ABC transporter ATPase n=1 Tax=Rothia sp. (in: high G+C Gram-positive bacteria) TaxID=1885016 RepID=UPI0026DF2850|nr:amino acid ABC transporter ATPase [Rothia sp. (in: high G+C Gram-positive bacteria)]MDO5751091.1 amino acid ABC transporter ATPase [Rothia sp. (in: high G+C Gram-positive bacteria)]
MARRPLLRRGSEAESAADKGPQAGSAAKLKRPASSEPKRAAKVRAEKTSAEKTQPENAHFDKADSYQEQPKRTRRRPVAAPESLVKNRAPLVQKRAKRGSARMVLNSFLAVIVAYLGFSLLLTVVIAQRQNDMVSLKAQETRLLQENQALNQDIGYRQAPQDLAIRASTLGMFVSNQPASLNVKTNTIEGMPSPAASPVRATPNLVAPPVVGSDSSYAQNISRAQSEADKKASAEASASASAAAARASASAAATSAAPAPAQSQAAQTQVPAPAQSQAAPAPAQSTAAARR